jgi:hypothetical protein
MTLHRNVWRAQQPVTFTLLGEGEPVTIAATPIVTSYWFGTTVGLVHRTANSFGHWQSSNVCGLLTAWRVAQLLPGLKQLRNQGSGYDATLCGLVIALGGDRHEDRMRERARDFGLTVPELEAELQRVNTLWPVEAELRAMWDRLPTSAQDGLSAQLRAAIADGHVKETPGLTHRLELSELRLRKAAEQKAHEEELIASGLPPEASLRRLLLDLGVTNLAYTVGHGELFDPTHFTFDDLDRAIMRELIGEWGYSRSVWLVTTSKQPDDASAHHAEGNRSVAMFWSDFGERGHPRVQLGGVAHELFAVRWDHVTERFVLIIRPLGLGDRDDSQDQQLSISDLRTRIGGDTGLGHPLLPGEMPAWLHRGWRRFGRRR